MMESGSGARTRAVTSASSVDVASVSDGARKKLLEFFEAWGVKDPATIAARRKLSRSALRNPDKRAARKRFYREMLRHHAEAQRLVAHFRL